jgi:hypothetical protein
VTLRENAVRPDGYTFRMTLSYRAATTDRRIGLLLTVLVHVGLIGGWQAVRTLPLPAAEDNAVRSRIMWMPLPMAKPRAPEPAPPRKEAFAPRPLPDLLPRSPRFVTPIPAPVPDTPATATAAPTPAAPAANTDAPPQAAAQQPGAAQILEQARRDIRGIDKALRKENKPYIAAPLDSPQIRLRRGIEQANAMAPNRLWEAPKVEELVNNTGDGARRSRVITGNGTYCVTERAPTTSIDMIEKHGKLRFTSCPQHETPATQQAWRTLQD